MILAHTKYKKTKRAHAALVLPQVREVAVGRKRIHRHWCVKTKKQKFILFSPRLVVSSHYVTQIVTFIRHLPAADAPHIQSAPAKPHLRATILARAVPVRLQLAVYRHLDVVLYRRTTVRAD